MDYTENLILGTNERIYGSIYKCKKCSYRSKTLFFILNHIGRHNSNLQLFDCGNRTVESYVCEKCAFVTPQMVILKRHVRSFHNDNKNLVIEKYIFNCYTCRKCEFETCSLIFWLKHIKLHVSKKLQSLVKGDTEINQLTNTTPYSSQWFQCTHCIFMCEFPSTFQHHALIKHALKFDWFKCEHCDYQTSRKSDLQKHFKNKHEIFIEWFQCEHCPYKAKDRNYLNRHVWQVHTEKEEMDWQYCPQVHCNYRCKNEILMKSHFLHKHF